MGINKHFSDGSEIDGIMVVIYPLCRRCLLEGGCDYLSRMTLFPLFPQILCHVPRWKAHAGPRSPCPTALNRAMNLYVDECVGSQSRYLKCTRYLSPPGVCGAAGGAGGKGLI